MTAWAAADGCLPTDETLAEQAYLVARGVRPLALAVHFPAVHVLRAATRVERHGGGGVIPWVIDHGDGIATCGYAGQAWVLDLYEWAVREPIPEEQRERVIGLLLGYSAPAVSEFEAHGCGRRFSTMSPARASTSPLCCNGRTAGTSRQRSGLSASLRSSASRSLTVCTYGLSVARVVLPIVGLVEHLQQSASLVRSRFLTQARCCLESLRLARRQAPPSTGRGS
jgi:hypothetical protein